MNLAIPKIKAIEIPGVYDLFAGIDGKIYCVKQNGTISLQEVMTQFSHKPRGRVKITIHDLESEDKVRIWYFVDELIAGTYHGWFRHLKVKHLNGDLRDSCPQNLRWVPKEFDTIRDEIDNDIGNMQFGEMV